MSEFVNDNLLEDVVGGAKQPTEPAGRGLKWYQIKPNETLIGIAKKCGTDYKYLARLNNIPDPNLIRAGKWIKVPA